MAELPQRHTIRWQGYDYANVGAFYLTIVTDDRRPLFGRIVDGMMHRSPIGELAQRCWDAIPQHMPHVGVGEFVVMPNHVHGIVVIRERLTVPVGARHDAPDTNALDAPDTNALNAPDTNALDGPGIGAGDAPDTTTNAPGTTNAPMTPEPKCPAVNPTLPTHMAITRGRVMTRPYGIRGNRRASRVARWDKLWRPTNPPLRAWHTAMGCYPTARPYGNAIIGTA